MALALEAGKLLGAIVVILVLWLLASVLGVGLAWVLRPVPKALTIALFVIVINGFMVWFGRMYWRTKEPRAAVSTFAFFMLNIVLVLAATGH